MCPACIAAIAWTTAGATSAGGGAALVVARIIRKKRRPVNASTEMDLNESRSADANVLKLEVCQLHQDNS